jgi:hypothetical protein
VVQLLAKWKLILTNFKQISNKYILKIPFDLKKFAWLKINLTMRYILHNKNSVMSLQKWEKMSNYIFFILCFEMLFAIKKSFDSTCSVHTHELIFNTQGVISTRTVRFHHANCNFHTQCKFERHERDSNKQARHFNTHKSDFYTKSAISTHNV